MARSPAVLLEISRPPSRSLVAPAPDATASYRAAEGVDMSPLKAGDTVKGAFIERLETAVISKIPLKPRF